MSTFIISDDVDTTHSIVFTYDMKTKRLTITIDGGEMDLSLLNMRKLYVYLGQILLGEMIDV